MAKSKIRIFPKLMNFMIIALFLLTACQSQVISTPTPKKKATNPPPKSFAKMPTSTNKSGSIPNPQKSTQPVNNSYSKFELSTSNRNIPTDLIEQMEYFVGGGQRRVPYYTPENKKLKMTFAKDGELLLYHLSGFQPKEGIRFLVYEENQGIVNLDGWERYQADEKGQLSIDFTDFKPGKSDYYFAAIGDISGECFPEGHGFMYSILKSESFQKCPSAPDQRVRVGDRARVCTKSDNLKVRSGPAKSKDSFMRIPPGTTMLIIDGPVCSDNWSWWKIRLNDGTEGWVAEGGDQTDPYYICPIN